MTLNNNGTTFNLKCIGGNTKNIEKADAKSDSMEMEILTNKRKCCDICVIGTLLLFGFMLLTFGLLTTKFTLYEIVLSERLKMDPILPGYFWWKNPTPEVLLKIHIFNITNSEKFISGQDDKLKLEEFGPIVFKEILEHKDVVFHSNNSTLSYTVERRIVLKESENVKGILNETVIVPNLAALAGASHVADGSWLLKKSFSVTMASFKTRPVKKTTIYDYFFNMSDPILQFTSKVVPFLVPTTETGILQNIYKNYSDRVNVKIGALHGGENFFKINTWNYRESVPGFYPENGDCSAYLNGSTEGALYAQPISKNSSILYWRKTLCRAVPLHFSQEIQWGKLKSYKFILREDVYDRSEDESLDCYKGSQLPDGLSDVSKCFFDQQFVASFPHFTFRPGNFTDKLEGMRPDPEKHLSYIIVEPTLGVPLNQRATSQSNIVTKDLSDFKADIARFSNMVIPLMWFEYKLEKITPVIVDTIDFIVNILPKIQYWISAFNIVVGLCLLILAYFRWSNRQLKSVNTDRIKNVVMIKSVKMIERI